MRWRLQVHVSAGGPQVGPRLTHSMSMTSMSRSMGVLQRKRAHTGFSFDHPGSESHFAQEVRLLKP